MNICYFLRGCTAPQAYTNPLAIKNFQRENPYSGVFYTVTTDDSSFEEVREVAESYANILAEKQKQDPLVVMFAVQENTFPLLMGRINKPLLVFGKQREKPITTFRELEKFNLRQITLNAEGMTSDAMQLLQVQLGTLNPEGAFIYRDFVIPTVGVEGSQKPLRERA